MESSRSFIFYQILFFYLILAVQKIATGIPTPIFM